MDQLIARVVVLARSIAARLTLLAAVLGVVAAQLEPFTTDPNVARVVAFIAAVVAVIAVIVRIVANVTPVLEQARGILPPPDPSVPFTAREAELVAELDRARQLHP